MDDLLKLKVCDKSFKKDDLISSQNKDLFLRKHIIDYEYCDCVRCVNARCEEEWDIFTNDFYCKYCVKGKRDECIGY